jgi:hypothetical protein
MTLYFSEKHIGNELSSKLRKNFPRGEISSNRLNIRRANTIDCEMLIKHFECAVAKTKGVYNVAITLPIDLEYQIPSWIVQGDGELWVNPKPDLKGLTTEGQKVFITEFHFYVDEKKLHKIPETKETPVQEALIEEFIEIRHALIRGNEEPIDIFRKTYARGKYLTPKTKVAKYLDSILKFEK